QILALQSLGYGAVAIDLGEPRFSRAPGDELDRRDVVDDRLRVWQAHHAGDAAGGGGLGAAGNGLHMLFAGLAKLHAHVDEAGRQALIVAANDLAAVRQAVAADGRPDFSDASLDSEQTALLLAPRGGVEQAGTQQGQRSPSGRHRSPRWGAARASE